MEEACRNASMDSHIEKSAPIGIFALPCSAALLAIGCAVAILVAAYKSRSSKPSQFLLSSFALDIAIAALFVPSAVWVMSQRGYCGRHLCSVVGFILLYYLINSSLHNVMLVIERLMAILFDVFHERHCCDKRINVYCVIVWFVSFFMAVFVSVEGWLRKHKSNHCPVAIVPNIQYTAAIVTFFLIGTMVSFGIYGFIFYKTRLQEHRIHVTNTLTYESYKAEVQVALMNLAHTLTYFLFWLPLVVFCLLLHTQRLQLDLTVPAVLSSVGLLTGPCRTLIIYCTSPELRHTCRQAVHCTDSQ